jgi:DNA polymerase
MLSSEKTHNTAQAASLVDWWKSAGVEYLVGDAPFDWLANEEEESVPVTRPSSPSEPDRQTNIPNQVAKTPPVAKHQVPRALTAHALIPPAKWPETLAALHMALGQGDALPGNIYGGKAALPKGEANVPLMIIGDLPDDEEIEAGYYGTGICARLLGNMIQAAGFDRADCYIAGLASTRPATGELPDEDLAELAAFALHHANLVNPGAILILGSAASRALLGKDLMEARANLPEINHIVGKKAATPTFHPRTLLARPMLKAQAWKDLQMIAKKDAL